MTAEGEGTNRTEEEDRLFDALDALCMRGYEAGDTGAKAKAVQFGKRAHFLVSSYYPDYRDSFVAAAESDMIERIFGVLFGAGETWESPCVKALVEFREKRQKARELEGNR